MRRQPVQRPDPSGPVTQGRSAYPAQMRSTAVPTRLAHPGIGFAIRMHMGCGSGERKARAFDEPDRYAGWIGRMNAQRCPQVGALRERAGEEGNTTREKEGHGSALPAIRAHQGRLCFDAGAGHAADQLTPLASEGRQSRSAAQRDPATGVPGAT
jgi:hypothetical protein